MLRRAIYDCRVLRDPALIPLSHQHQHALALCVFVQRAMAASAPAAVTHWESEVARTFANEIRFHFTAEEQWVFPAAEAHAGMHDLVAELRREHEVLRTQYRAADEHRLGAAGLRAFATALNDHVRKEERQLFEQMQVLLPAAQLAELGAAIDEYFRASGVPPQSCGLPFRPPDAE